MSNNYIYQGFCDLALGYVYIKEERLEDGMALIDRANKNGVLDSNDLDEEMAETLKKLLNIYKNK